MLGLRDCELEWVFDKGRLYGRAGAPQHLAFIVSAAFRSAAKSNAELVAAAEAALRRYFPAMAEARVTRALVQREPSRDVRVDAGARGPAAGAGHADRGPLPGGRLDRHRPAGHDRGRRAQRRAAARPCGGRSCSAREAVAASTQSGRSTSGNDRQTGTPQKCSPSVQVGVTQAVAEHAGRAHVADEARVQGAHLRQLVHRGAVDLLLRVEAGAHHPLVREVEQAARSRGSAAPWRSAAGRAPSRAARPARAGGSWPPRRGPSPPRNTSSARRVRGDQGRRHVVGPARVRERHQRPRGGDHAVALVLAVGGVRELLQERVRRVVHGARERASAPRAGASRAGSGCGPGRAAARGPRRRRASAGRRPARRAPPRRSSARRVPSSRRAATCARAQLRVERGPPRRRRPRRAAAAAPRRSRPPASGPCPIRSKKAGSRSLTSATIASTTARVSAGASPVRIMRCSRCSTMPGQRVHHAR